MSKPNQVLTSQKLHHHREKKLMHMWNYSNYERVKSTLSYQNVIRIKKTKHIDNVFFCHILWNENQSGCG